MRSGELAFSCGACSSRRAAHCAQPPTPPACFARAHCLELMLARLLRAAAAGRTCVCARCARMLPVLAPVACSSRALPDSTRTCLLRSSRRLECAGGSKASCSLSLGQRGKGHLVSARRRASADLNCSSTLSARLNASSPSRVRFSAPAMAVLDSWCAKIVTHARSRS